ncbi:Threonine--tRNA ligase [Sporomusa rhizae]|uniref:threonine--tRNA ligase n=1 Tax=Sporomusa rhizae TaxID=357999 RepID=UPI003529FFAA
MVIRVTLKNGISIEVPFSTTCAEIAKQISSGLAKEALAAEFDGKVVDLTTTISADCSLRVVTFDDEAGKKVLRHTAAHVLAQAVKNLYPQVKLAIGPAIETGFYYDFDSEVSFSADDLGKIENEMKRIIKQNLALERFVLNRAEAIQFAEQSNEPYKAELIRELPDGQPITFYRQGDFVDLCAGPHLPNTGRIKAVKLISCTGAYWRGNSNNKMLQRIYGTAFTKQSELDSYLTALEEAKKRDHRKIGKELDLFSIDEYIGPGLILWHPKLSVVREEIELYWRKEHRRRGYEYIYTPHIGQSNLWETSGHLDHFAEGMYPAMKMAAKDEAENTRYYVKPMSCPFHVRMYKTRPRSYRELPIRWCELGSVYRFEKSGALHGMLRVRGFTQDDAHIVCTEDQFVDEVNNVLDFALAINKAFGYDKLNVYLSVRDLQDKEKFIDNEPVWQLAESTLEKILGDRGIEFKKDIGGAKFYGPAIDLKAVDAMGREWQGTTIQLDMNLPERFGMTYVGSDGKEHTPIMLHRTLLGSMERFVGTLIEHYAGAFPVWLAPVQVKILAISERNHEYANKVLKTLRKSDIRVELDDRSEKIGYKIREAQLGKVPYMLILGDKEQNENVVAVRDRKNGETKTMSMEAFLALIDDEIVNKK